MKTLAKKLIFLFYTAIFAVCFYNASFAAAFGDCSYVTFCPPKAYNLSSKMVQKISMKIGATYLSERIAESRIKDELKKFTSQKLDVKVNSYSFQDLIHGRLKTIVISGKNLNFEGIYLTSLMVKTLCDFNYVQLDKESIKFKENMILSFSTVISDKDLMKTMESSGYLDKLNCVNVEGCGITFFKLSGAGVRIVNNKLYFKVRVTSQLLLEKPLDITMSTDLTAKKGRIVLTKIDLGNFAKGLDLTKVANQINTMNPLTFSLEVLENKNTKMCIKNVEIFGDKIQVSGNIFIPKNSTLGK